MKEIEFKYVVDKIPEGLEYRTFNQIYFNPQNVEKLLCQEFNLKDLNNISTTRIRHIVSKDLNKWILTIKTVGLVSRDEYEKEISGDVLDLILAQPITSQIIKRRYYDHYLDYTFEYDEYLNLLYPLLTCEVEVKDELTIHQAVIEQRFNDLKIKYYDVSHDASYKNSNLTRKFGVKDEKINY